MKRFLTFLLAACLALLAGCARKDSAVAREYVSWDYFDTLISIEYAGENLDHLISGVLERQHAVFDMHSPHAGVNGVYALNAAGGEWVSVEPELMELLLLCREWGGISRATDVTQGCLYALWHDFREGGELPTALQLSAARAAGGWENVEIDELGGRVRLLDADTRIDMGAVAKGYACRMLAGALEANGCAEYLISAGGSVTAGRRAPAYSIGVADPSGEGIALIMEFTELSAVTSGGYQRYRELDGMRYHHLIDVDTLYPGAHGVLQATVICADPALGDFMSTCLFLTDYEEGRYLAEKAGVDAIWILEDGRVEMTDGAQDLLK